eukprot:1030299-Amphidinium_carterae.1
MQLQGGFCICSHLSQRAGVLLLQHGFCFVHGAWERQLCLSRAAGLQKYPEEEAEPWRRS